VLVSLPHLPTVHGQSRHHDSRVPLLPAHVDGPSEAPLVGVVSLNDVSLIDDYICVDICRVDPISCHILGQATPRLDHFALNYKKLFPDCF
jgi:hypothetical protein